MRPSGTKSGHIPYNICMAIPNLRKIFASFRTKEDEAEFGRRALYNLIGFIGSVVAFKFFFDRISPK